MSPKLYPSAMTYRQLQLAIKAIREDKSCNIPTPKLNSKKVVLIEWLDHYRAIAAERADYIIEERTKVRRRTKVVSLFEHKVTKGDLIGAIELSIIEIDKDLAMARQVLADLKAAERQLDAFTENILAQYPLL